MISTHSVGAEFKEAAKVVINTAANNQTIEKALFEKEIKKIWFINETYLLWVFCDSPGTSEIISDTQITRTAIINQGASSILEAIEIVKQLNLEYEKEIMEAIFEGMFDKLIDTNARRIE